MSSGDAQALSMAKVGHFVDLEFDGRRDDWHVNDRIGVGSDETMEDVLTHMLGDELSGMATLGMVLQMADASEEWLVVTLNRSDDGDIEFGDAALAGKSPDSRESVEADITVHHVAPNLTGLVEAREDE